MDVSAIVINWNTRELLHRCLKSIYEQAGDVAFEIIVVDNASTDGSCDMVRELFPEVILISNNTNKGYAAAVNQGMRIAKGRYLLVLNSDIQICESAIAKTVCYADKQAEAAVIGCQVREDGDKIHRTCRRFPSLLNQLLETFGLNRIFYGTAFFDREYMGDWNRDSGREVDVISGMFMLVRRKAMDEAGVMDEAFFFLFEETDWCYRFSKAGWKMLFWPGACVIHLQGGGQSRKKAGIRIAMQYTKGMLIFYRKHYSYAEYILVLMLLTVDSAVRCLVWKILTLLRKLAGKDAQYADAKARTYWWSFWFCTIGIEPGTGALRRLPGAISRRIKDGIETVFALGYELFSLLLHRPPKRTVLYYHAMKQRDAAGFENQMQYLAKHCRVVRASEVVAAPPNGPKPTVAIVFDDAFTSVRDNALPILRRYGITAAIAVPVKAMGRLPNWQMDNDYNDGDETVLDAKEVAELDRMGCEILSHTVSHCDLVQLHNGELETELCQSKRLLEEIVGHVINGIAYPYGACDAKVCEAAAKAGYRFGFSVEPQTVQQSKDSLCIGRFKVLPDESMLRFKLKADGSYRVAGFLRRLKRMLTGHRTEL